MKFSRRLFLYLIGVTIGSLFCLVLFGPERFSCSGYLPEGRVLEELKTKTWENDSVIISKLAQYNVTEKDIKDSILTYSTINFSESEPRKKPCGQYILYFPEKKPKLQLEVEKCKETAKIISIQEIVNSQHLNRK